MRRTWRRALLALARWVERRLGSQGPVPGRIRSMARWHREAHPDAGDDRWEQFAAELASEFYLSGYRAGLEAQVKGEHPPVEPGDVPAWMTATRADVGAVERALRGARSRLSPEQLALLSWRVEEQLGPELAAAMREGERADD